MKKRNVVIMGAAGRDFHNFNTVFRQDETKNVVAFTATQIPDIDGRRYPPELAGPLYPDGIPILAESELPRILSDQDVDDVIFSYSDVPHEYVMHKASLVNSLGANFILLGGKETMLRSSKPVIAVNAVRTGSGKSQTSRAVVQILKSMGKNVVSVRHPMPYGDLVRQKVQRYAGLEDLKRHQCTIEEMEEYEPHIDMGSIIYAGVDYEAILREAEKEADVIIWDGGNNDTSFYKADLVITVADPHRAGHEIAYYPGESNLLMADVVVINKIDTADPDDVNRVRRNIQERNPKAVIIDAASPLHVDHPEAIRNKRVLVVEDGPTLTHGEMRYGAGTVAARKFAAAEIIDPRQWTVGSISDTYKKYPDIGCLLPAMGYGYDQVVDLQSTIENVDCDTVIIGTPIDLNRIIHIRQATARVSYTLQEIGEPTLQSILEDFLND